MSNLILGLFYIIINIILSILGHLSWWSVLGIACGAALFGFGVHEYYVKKHLV